MPYWPSSPVSVPGASAVKASTGALGTDTGVVALMLAAGRSQRFGSDKRRVRLATGQTLLQTSCTTVAAAGLPLYLALRPEDELAELLPGSVFPAADPAAWLERIHRIDIPRADRGMGVSLAGAVAALPACIPGCLVLLGDMPALQVSTLQRLALTLAECGRGALVAPVWQGQRGHPVGFGRDWFAELSRLDGDRGARELLQREQDRLRYVPVEDPGILRDIDTVADLICG